MTDTHTRWGWGPVRGAYGPTGGHWRVLGFYRGWINQWDDGAKWSPTWSLDFFGCLYITHEPWRGTRWALGRLSLTFKRAPHRIGERERRQERRRARKHIDRALAVGRLTAGKAASDQ